MAEAGSLAWAEVSLGVNYSFIPPATGETTYIVPTPVNLTTNNTLSWLSDVVAMHPACEWVAPRPLSDTANFSDFFSTDIVMNVDSKQVQVEFSIGDRACRLLKDSYNDYLIGISHL